MLLTEWQQLFKSFLHAEHLLMTSTASVVKEESWVAYNGTMLFEFAVEAASHTNSITANCLHVRARNNVRNLFSLHV
jgi:hypothetical protein